MPYRVGDEEARVRSEVEIAAREALDALASGGRAKGPCHREELREPYVPLLPRREIRARLRSLSWWGRRRLARRYRDRPASRVLAFMTLGLVVITVLLLVTRYLALFAIYTIPVAVVCALLAVLARVAEAFEHPYPLEEEISWLATLPFPVDGYLEAMATLGLTTVSVHVDLDLPEGGQTPVRDFLAGIDEPGHPTALTVENDLLRLRSAPGANPRAFLGSLIVKLLLPLHRLHSISNVTVRGHNPYD